MKSKARYPLTKIPDKMDIVVSLLREELRAEYFFNHLAAVGFEDSQFRPNLGSIALTLMNFDLRPDDLMDFYVTRLNHYVKKIKDSNESITKQAFKFYSELKRERKRRKSFS